MKIALPDGELSVAFDGNEDARTLLVLAHGAGGDLSGEFMAYFAGNLGNEDLLVCRFNFRYAELKKKAPDRQAVLEDTYRAVVEAIRAERKQQRLIVGGKSMGCRIASQVAASGTGVDGLVFLGYPLHPPGRPERLRDSHLPQVGAPMLFVEGTRDPFCPLETLRGVLAVRRLDATVAVIEDGDHSLKVRKSSGRSTRDAWAEAVSAIQSWIATL